MYTIKFHSKRALESIQIDACRIIRGGTKLCSIQKLYDETGFETLQERHQKYRLCQMFKMTNGLAPFYEQTLLPQSVQQQSRYSLWNSNYTIPLTWTVSYFNAFVPTALREWNSLDQNTRDCAILGMFKRKLNAPVNHPPVYFRQCANITKSANSSHSLKAWV